MIQIVEEQEHRSLSLEDYAADAKFVAAVNDLRVVANSVRERLNGRTIWMINSTARGGGVAEMLPRMMSLMRELELKVRWAVIGTEEQAFFKLTKRLHNLIHGDERAGVDLTGEDARVYEAVNRENFESFRKHVTPDDLVVVHDPQPLPLGQMIARELGNPTLWRCHIGLAVRNAATSAAWKFLKGYLDGYEHAAFSVSEYIPSFLAQRSSVLHPAIDPLSHKNRDLAVNKMVTILCNSGLQDAHHPVPSEDFAHKVQRYLPSGEVAVPGEVGMLFRPSVLQVSRWDRLKGWVPLLEGFARMKRQHWETGSTDLEPLGRRIVDLSRLVLAGPDPSSIADDPEGLEVLGQIQDAYRSLEPALQRDVLMLLLPMASRKENALIVNALQRCATLVAQNSLQEGFGLTVTEAMWKKMPVLGTRAAGIRQQIRDGIDGQLNQDAEDSKEIAGRLKEMLADQVTRQTMARNAQRRVYDEFLVFRQISRYLQLLNELVTAGPTTGPVA